MKGKEKSHGCTLPQGLRHPVQDQEEQQCICQMEEQADQVMTRRVHPEDLDIQLMGKPCQRVPVAGMGRGESPGQIACREAPSHVGVLGDVLFIVEVDEIVAGNLPEDGKRDQRKNKRYKDFPMPGGHSP
jgi:hypothetical protein